MRILKNTCIFRRSRIIPVCIRLFGSFCQAIWLLAIRKSFSKRFDKLKETNAWSLLWAESRTEFGWLSSAGEWYFHLMERNVQLPFVDIITTEITVKYHSFYCKITVCLCILIIPAASRKGTSRKSKRESPGSLSCLRKQQYKFGNGEEG